MAQYSNALSVIRQYLSATVGDLIQGSADSGSSTTLVDTMLRKPNDFYNNLGYRSYIYAGTAIGEEREISDWVFSTNTLTLAPAGSAIDNTSKYELHRIFWEDEYRKAINLAIESVGDSYLVPLLDSTTVKLTSSTDNLSDTVYTWEYTMPANMLYVHKIVAEEAVDGIKLTGSVSGTFTVGETVTGGTSQATGELAYGPSGSAYIRVRKASGTFIVGETATGGTSSETCSSITAVDNENAGNNRWLEKDVLDWRSWNIVKPYPDTTPSLRIDKRYFTIEEDLYLRLEGQRKQPTLTADTSVCYLPLDWVVQKAITFLPKNKVQSNKLDMAYAQAESYVRSRQAPKSPPHPFGRKVVG